MKRQPPVKIVGQGLHFTAQNAGQKKHADHFIKWQHKTQKTGNVWLPVLVTDDQLLIMLEGDVQLGGKSRLPTWN